MKKLITLLGILAASCSPLPAQNTLAGNLTVQQTVKLTGAASPSQITSNVDDYAPTGFATAAVLRLQSDVPRTITGLAGGTAGRMLWLTNVGAQTISLATESASSSAANRFAFGASSFDLVAGGSISIWYDTTSSRWRSATNLAAGGGGGTIDQTARDAAAAAQATADGKQDALSNASTLAKITEAAGLPLWDGAAWPGGGSGGTGSVTGVSVVTANGVSGSVANPSTTPAITLSLGAITPTSVAATGTVAGSNLSGTNTGDQSDVTLTFSDVTTNNVSTARHGFAPKAPNDATQFLNGSGAWSVPVHNSTASIQGGTTGEAYHLTSAQHTEAGHLLTNSVTGSTGVQRLQMDTATAATSPNTEGYVTWDTAAGTLQVGMKGSQVTMQVGQEMPFRCRNVSGATIPNGAVVRLTGWSGNVPEVTIADNTTAAGSSVFGIATEELTNNSFGYVTTVGVVRGLNTSSLTQSSITWLGASGALTSTKPTSPAKQVAVGFCLYSHSTEGAVLVGPEAFHDLGGLSDVKITTLANGQVLKWTAATNTWDNATLTKSDVGLGSVENTALSAWTGSSNLATVGTITAGTWTGSAIADAYIASAAAWNAKVSFPGFGTTGTTAAVGNDSRLSDARPPLAHNQAWSTITSTPTTLSGYGIADAQPLDSDLTSIAALSTTSFGRSLLTQPDAAAARGTIGAGTSSFDGVYSSLSGIPSTFTPTAHNQAVSTISDSTTIGQNLVKLTNPGAITFPRFNSDNTVSALDGASFRTAIGVSSGSGDVVGPSSATDNAVARFDGTTGKLVQNSSVFVGDSGKLGVGVTPLSTLHTQTSGANNDFTTTAYGGAVRWVSQVAEGTSGAPTYPANGRQFFALQAYGWDQNTAAFAFTGDIGVSASEAWSATAHGSHFRIRVTQPGTTTARELMFAYGTGVIRFPTYGAGTLVTDSSGNITASSDRRLKNITGKFTRGLDAVMQIQPKVFTWKPESGMNTADVNVGFIAQDVQPAIPEAVGTMKTVDTEEDDGTGKKVKKLKREASEYLTLSDRPIIAALVNAVKELKAENDALSDRLSKLEGKK